MFLDQVKYTYACLTAFIMTEHWLKQPKMLPCLIVVECQTIKMHQPQNTPVNKLSLTDVRMSLVQIKYTYPCTPAFIMTEQWLKQPKMMPCHIAMECQTMKMHQPAQNFSK